jgi:TolA-binding protein
MNDPVRLLEVGADDFEAKLLRAGRSDAIPARSRAQILAGIGIGGLLTATTMASGVRAAVSKAWLATAGVGGGALAIWAGVWSQAPESKPDVPPPAPVAPAARPARPLEPSRPPAVAPAPEPEAPAAPPTRPRSAPVERDASLSAELAALEQARGAFLRRDYSQTLRLLDDYGQRFPKRHLGTEATVLRIEALAARGDRQSATRIGRDFLQSHPNGPYAQRVRSVIGDTNSAPAP